MRVAKGRIRSILLAARSRDQSVEFQVGRAIRGRDCISARARTNTVNGATGLILSLSLFLSPAERNGNEPHPLHKGAATEASKPGRRFVGAVYTGWFCYHL